MSDGEQDQQSGDPEFARHLYRGVAEFYDQFRLPYAPPLINRLLSQAQPGEPSRVLDLACGTGQLTFMLVDHFAEVWAVDQEPDQIAVLQNKINSRLADRIRPVVSSAEELSVPPGTFDLVVIGNAFHRLPRESVANLIVDWLRPGGQLALFWSNSPWVGEENWQPTFRKILADWQEKLEVRGRIPSTVGVNREVRPNDAILAAAGLELRDRHEVTAEHRWTTAELAGFVYSTSFLSAPLFGDRTAEFEADLRGRLQAFLQDGKLVDQVSQAYDLYERPASSSH